MKTTKITTKKTSFFLVISILLVSLIGFTSAYGIASPYWEGHPLQIAPGDIKTASITIQNVGTEDIVVRTFLTQGSEIASIREGEYLVPAGTIDTEILVTISVPENSSFESLHKVTISTSEVASGIGEGVTLTTAFGTTFDVLVLDVPKTIGEEGTSPLVFIVLILVVVTILTFLLRKKSKRKR